MQPINLTAEVQPVTDYERSCNCCNDVVCESQCCCFPFLRRRRNARQQQTQQTAQKVLHAANQALQTEIHQDEPRAKHSK